MVKLISNVKLSLLRINNILKFLNEYNKRAFVVPKNGEIIYGNHSEIDAYKNYLKQGLEQDFLEYRKSFYFEKILKDIYEYSFASSLLIDKELLAPAIALSRKPFEDSLNYLEWLLVNYQDLLTNIYIGDTKKYCIKDGKIIKSNKRTEIKKMLLSFCESDEEKAFIKECYEKRYNAEIHYSMRGIWDYSLHNVTLNKNYKTHEHHINMITFNRDYMNKIYTYFLINFNFLLVYTLEIVKKFINPLLKESDYKKYNIDFVKTKLILNNFDIKRYE